MRDVLRVPQFVRGLTDRWRNLKEFMHACFWLGLVGALSLGGPSLGPGEQLEELSVFPVVVALLGGLGGGPDWQYPTSWEVLIDGYPTKVIGVSALLPPLFWGEHKNASPAVEPARKSFASQQSQAAASIVVLANLCSSSTLRLAVQSLSRDLEELLRIGPINVIIVGKTPEILCKDVREKTLLTKCFSRLSRISVSNEIIRLRRELGDKRKGLLTPILALGEEAGTLLEAARGTRIVLDEIGMFPTVLFLIWDGAEESGIDFWRHRLAASSSTDRGLSSERSSPEHHFPQWEDLLRELDVYLAESYPFRGFGDLATYFATKGVVVVSLVPPLPIRNENGTPFDRRGSISGVRSETAFRFSPTDLLGLTPQDVPSLLAVETGGLVLSPRVMVQRDLTPLANRAVLWVPAASRREGLASIKVTKAPRKLVWAPKACCGLIPEPVTAIQSAEGQSKNLYKVSQPFAVAIRVGQLLLEPQLASIDEGTSDGRRVFSLSIRQGTAMADLRTTSLLAGTLIRKKGNERYSCNEWMWHGSEIEMEGDTLRKRFSLPISGPLELTSLAVVDVNSGSWGLVVVAF